MSYPDNAAIEADNEKKRRLLAEIEANERQIKADQERRTREDEEDRRRRR